MKNSRLAFAALAAAAALLMLGAPALAGPDGANVVGGAATVAGQGTATVTVTQSSDRAIINWRQFDLSPGELARFNQPSNSAITLNRVTGGLGPSQIYGTISANGRVFLINRDGILIGPGAVIDTAGFLATTHDIKNDDFLAGRFLFGIPGRPDASIVNQGTITASTHGFAALVAPGVRNTGTITANLGTVAMAAGNGFTLDFYGDKLITLGVNDQIAHEVRDVATGQPLSSLVKNEGLLRANGGRVELTAATARRVVDSVINNTGVIEANSFHRRGGTIVLSAGTGDAASRAAGHRQTVRVSGTVSAAAKKGKGGKVIVTGEHIEVANARIDASGKRGGGTVLIGGDWAGGRPDKSLVTNGSARLEPYSVPTAATVTVDIASVIDASAKGNGPGGKVIVWADGTTTFGGTILARGGPLGGDGGFVETSGHGVLNFTGNVDTRAPMGAAGTLLLDPFNVTISAATSGGGSFSGGTWTPSATGSTISTTDLQNQLAANNVVVTTGGQGSPGGDPGNISVNNNVTWGNNNTLTLSAFNNISVAAGVTISNTAGGNLILRADNSGTGVGTIQFPAAFIAPLPLGKIDFSQSTGKVSFYYNPGNYTAPTNFTPNVVPNPGAGNQFTAYMLVNNTNNLQGIATNTNGAYALGTNINASGYVGMPTGTVFNGVLDGNGGLGQNTVSNLPFGIFQFIGSSGVARNLTLNTVNINATANNQFIGALAGNNSGTISNVSVSGAVSGSTFTGILAGGLVGQNQGGTITQAQSSASVTVGNATAASGVTAGGLVGYNQGTITQSSASGAVAGGNSAFIGGLAGRNDSVVSNSSATGNVIVASGVPFSSTAGGLVGFNSSGASVTNSTASGNVSGGSFAFIGGVVGQNGGLVEQVTRNAGTVSATGTVSQQVSVGGLVGNNNGTVRNSNASTTVIGTFASAGGLVGNNQGTVIGTAPNLSFATANVTVSGDASAAGGLVGQNGAGGQVQNSSATGTVGRVVGSNVNDLLKLGGLVGQNFGTITQSTAAVPINAGMGSFGGLVGENDGTVTASSAAGNIAGAGTGPFAAIGGLVGNNGFGSSISNSSATGAVTGGATTNAGGLAGQNAGSINASFASGLVTINGVRSAAGGLVGFNVTGGTITNSQAFGNVVSTGNGTTTQETTDTGGLVGGNQGTISGTTLPGLNSTCAQGTSFSCAMGAITVGAHGTAGGLVGFNQGNVTNTFATGAVSGASGFDNGGNTNLGGLAGANIVGTITGSHARGAVTGHDFAQAGGFVGDNGGTITNSFARGNVTVGDNSDAGGFAGAAGEVQTCSQCGGISNSQASGNVTGGAASFVGGFAGSGGGALNSVLATGAVTAGHDSLLGGLIGALGGSGSITQSQATGAVNALGANSIAGGLVGGSFGTVTGSTATGAVTVASESYAGGLVGMNLGRIQQSSTPAAATVTGSGLHNVLGGLIGVNAGTVTQSTSAGAVNGAAFSVVGGLVGANVVVTNIPAGTTFTGSSFPIGTITSSSATTGAATGGDGSTVGGLIGANGASISGLSSTQNVTGGIGSIVGGLVGVNGGPPSAPAFPVAITGCSEPVCAAFAAATISDAPGSIANSLASGAVNGGTASIIGGLVGQNPGSINQSSASGIVTGTGALAIGGLVGHNDTGGTISNASATGTVNGDAATVIVGGLVGLNDGSIVDSKATGAVSGSVYVGGFVGVNTGFIDPSSASGAVTASGGGVAAGFAALNTGTIAQSSAGGQVSVSEGGTAAGFVGFNAGTISNSFATSPVLGSDGAAAGGFAGFNYLGTISKSFAAGPVTVGANGVAGGFVAENFGQLTQVFSTGAVTGGANSTVGGLAAINIGFPTFTFPTFAGSNTAGSTTNPTGTILQSFATGPVIGGANSTVGGLVGDNSGAIDQSYAAGPVSSGPGSTLGGLVASNNTNAVPGSGFGSGTITNSYWDTQGTGQSISDGGTGQTTAQMISGLPSGFDPAVWNINSGQSYPYLRDPAPNPVPVVTAPPSPPPAPPQQPDVTPPTPPITQPIVTPPVTQPIVQPLFTVPPGTPLYPNQQIVDLSREATITATTPAAVVTPVVATPAPAARPAARQTTPNGNSATPPVPRVSGMPPPGENRFIQDQVVFQVCGDVPEARVRTAARSMGLTLIGAQKLGLVNCTVYQYRIADGKPVRDKIRGLEALRIITTAQPNYVFELTQLANTPAAAGAPEQYTVEKLRLAEVHRIARGKNVRVALIDSQVDAAHPDLEGVFAERFSALGTDDKPHPHGTGMAGAIASHKRLLGVAPGARLLAVHAFGTAAKGGQGTSVEIIKGLDWAVAQGARVVNMSFAGPKDTLLLQAIKIVHDKGIVIIAAAGNAGPKSPPLYPGADPNVIAVTAIDADEKSFTGANRGRYVAVAAPGVDVLVPAPDGGYQLTTGTSVAAAHVSGVAALLLERDPKLTPAEIRSILITTAKPLATKGGRDDEFGYGLVDPLKAVQSINAKSAANDNAPAAESVPAPLQAAAR